MTQWVSLTSTNIGQPIKVKDHPVTGECQEQFASNLDHWYWKVARDKHGKPLPESDERWFQPHWNPIPCYMFIKDEEDGEIKQIAIPTFPEDDKLKPEELIHEDDIDPDKEPTLMMEICSVNQSPRGGDIVTAGYDDGEFTFTNHTAEEEDR